MQKYRVYTPDDALKWASFSGDRNPLHFPGSGHAGIVHGMRLLDDMKRICADAMLQHYHPEASVTVQGRFRIPVHYHEHIWMAQRESCRGYRCDAINGKGAEAVSLLWRFNQTDSADEEQHDFTGWNWSDVQDAYAQYAALYGHVAAWVFLDAYFFRCLFRSDSVAGTGFGENSRNSIHARISLSFSGRLLRYFNDTGRALSDAEICVRESRALSGSIIIRASLRSRTGVFDCEHYFLKKGNTDEQD